jgi:hypothetical protein
MPTIDHPKSPFGITEREARDPFGAKKERMQNRKERNEAAKFDRIRELSDLKAVMQTPEGRRFVWRLITLGGVYRLSYQGNSDDTAFNEGRRSVGLVLMADTHDHMLGLYQTMEKEQLHELNERRKEDA